MSYFDDNEDYIIFGRQREEDDPYPARRRPARKSAPAGSALASARIAAHAAFDPLWQTGKMTRSAAYALLAKRMGVPKHEAHMQMFDLAQCERVIQLFLTDDFDIVPDTDGSELI